MGKKILLPQALAKEGEEYLISKGYEIVRGKSMKEEDIKEDIVDCDAIIVRLPKITREIFEKANKLKVLARHGAGYDGIDLEAARDHNVLVLNAPGANSISVAELTIFYMLYCSRKFKKVQKYILEDYLYAKMKIQKNELYQKTLGLIGIGNIGGLVAKKAFYGFDMKIIAYDPYAKKENVAEYIELTDNRDDVFKNSDYVSLHLPSTPSTINSVGEHEFSIMKESAYIINTSRGDLIDEKALVKALEDEQIAGAGLDVVRNEPLEGDNPLLKFDNVIIGPHIGGATQEATTRSSMMCAEGVDDFLSGRTPKHVVPEMRDMIKE